MLLAAFISFSSSSLIALEVASSVPTHILLILLDISFTYFAGLQKCDDSLCIVAKKYLSSHFFSNLDTSFLAS